MVQTGIMVARLSRLAAEGWLARLAGEVELALALEGAAEELAEREGLEMPEDGSPGGIEPPPASLLARLSEMPGAELYMAGNYYSPVEQDVRDGGALSFGSLHAHGRVRAADVAGALAEGLELVLIPPACSGSDYGGDGAVSRSNCRVLLESHGGGKTPGTVEMSGGHFSYGVACSLLCRSDELAETLAGLEDYPLIDEDDHSELEIEEQGEAWESYVRQDFRSELEAALPGIDLGAVPGETLWAYFRILSERSNTYWEHSCEGASLDLEQVTESALPAEVAALPGVALEDVTDAVAAVATLERLGIQVDGERALARSWTVSGGADRFPTHEMAVRAWQAAGGTSSGAYVARVDEAPTVPLPDWEARALAEVPLAPGGALLVGRGLAALARLAEVRAGVERVNEETTALALSTARELSMLSVEQVRFNIEGVRRTLQRMRELYSRLDPDGYSRDEARMPALDAPGGRLDGSGRPPVLFDGARGK